MDAAPVFGTQVFDRQRIRNTIRIESMSLISDDDEHSLGAFAAAPDMNQLASVHAIAVEYRVTHGFPKGEFNELLLSANATGFGDEAYEPVHERRDQPDVAAQPGLHFHRNPKTRLVQT